MFVARVFALVFVCATAAFTVSGSRIADHSGVPSTLWLSEFGSGATFGDPVAFCRAGPRHSLSCFVSVIVFNSSVLGANASLVTLRADTGSIEWHQPLPSGVAPLYNGWVTVGQSRGTSNDTLFTATATTILAFDAFTGDALWSVPAVYTAPPTAPPAPTVPAHPTYFAGRVFYTFESGVNSSNMVAINATDGSTLWVTPDIVVTLIWPVALPNLVAYTGQDVATGDVYVTARRVDGTLAWRHGPLAWSPPGLWDNPNLDVDAEGAIVFMYAKPHIGLRQVTAFDATNGVPLWTVNDTHAEYILDYDTYAYAGDFFRLTTINATSMQLQRLDGVTGASKWRSVVATADENSILLVGNGLAMQFGLSSRAVQAFDAGSGGFAWDTAFLKGSPTTGTTVTVPVWRFGTLYRVTLVAFGLVPSGCFRAVVAAEERV